MSNILLLYEHLFTLTIPKVSRECEAHEQSANIAHKSCWWQYSAWAFPGERFYSPYQNPLLYIRHDSCHNDHSLIPSCNLLLDAIHFYLICSRAQRLTVRRTAWISVDQHSPTSCRVWASPCRLHLQLRCTGHKLPWVLVSSFCKFFLPSEPKLPKMKALSMLVLYAKTTVFYMASSEKQSKILWMLSKSMMEATLHACLVLIKHETPANLGEWAWGIIEQTWSICPNVMYATNTCA